MPRKKGKDINSQYFEPEVLIFCKKCDRWIPERVSPDILNIEEDIQGRDLLSFICPYCNTVQKSYRKG